MRGGGERKKDTENEVALSMNSFVLMLLLSFSFLIGFTKSMFK